MNAKTLRWAFAWTIVAAAGARCYAWATEPGLHPDEFFQYLEPAWARLTGTGLLTWEWRDGVRSWVLPGYHGAWMAALRVFGVHSGATLGRFLQAHWAFASLSLAPAGWLGGSAIARQLAPRGAPARAAATGLPLGWAGGLFGSILTALFPLLVTFSVHTLSELPSMLCFTWAYALTSELTEKQRLAGAKRSSGSGRIACVGVLLACGACLRIANAPLALVPPLALLWARGLRAWAPVVLGAALPLLLFGVVDYLTWGGLFESYIRYVKFNFIEGKAATFGVSGAWYYTERVFSRLPVGLPVLVVLALYGLRATWPYVLAFGGLLAYLSTQAHKEERFIVVFWPLLLIAAAGAAGALFERWGGGASGRTGRSRVLLLLRTWGRPVVAVAGLLLVLMDGARNCRWPEWTRTREYLDAQAWAGHQVDVSGVLVEDVYWSGGQMWFGTTLPEVEYAPRLLSNPLFSHVIGKIGGPGPRAAEAAGFSKVWEHAPYVIFRRPRAPKG